MIDSLHSSGRMFEEDQMQKLAGPVLQLNLTRVAENVHRFLATSETIFQPKKTRVFFATKSHPDYRILKFVAEQGLGCEVMRTEHLGWAKSLAMPAIVSGFVKSPALLGEAVGSAEYIIVETEFELPRLEDLAVSTGTHPSVLLRVKTSPKSKVGCTQEAIKEIANSTTKLDLRGVHFHAGWNVTDDRIVVGAMERMAEALSFLHRAGRYATILNFGGSFCEHAANAEQLRRRMELFASIADEEIQEIHFEPGRYIVGDAGHLTCRVEYVDVQNRILYLNTCAYAHRLTGATPQALLPDAPPDGPLGRWTLYGFWPTEGDRLENVTLNGQPHSGDVLVLTNMGAYSLGLQNEFSSESLVCMTYV